MKIIKRIREMQRQIKKIHLKNKTIGFVPTMGYLHEGHLSLIRKAKKDTDCVVISIFVNPIQFGPKEDFQRYPRDLKRDEALAKKEGVDIIFYPSIEEMYPGEYLTYVEVEKLTSVLCGASRPGHFRGVTTVVTKLFHIVQPDIAYFGWKDAQQAIIIKKMVKDLNFPIQIKLMPTIREADGLAMSSRNAYLNYKERKDAICLYQALQMAKRKIKAGCRDSKKIITEMKQVIKKKQSARIEYISIVDTENLEPQDKIKGKILIALAVWIGKTRLIDNIIIKN